MDREVELGKEEEGGRAQQGKECDGAGKWRPGGQKSKAEGLSRGGAWTGRGGAGLDRGA